MSQEGINVLKFFYSCWTCAVGIILIVISAVFFVQFATDAEQFQQLLNNWSKKPFDDVQIVAGSQSCPAQYDNIINFQYQGTTEGCACNVGNQLQANACCTNAKSSKCNGRCYGNKVAPLAPFNMTLWGYTSINNQNQINTYKICVKTLDLTFLDNAPQEPKCPSDQKSCGGSDSQKLTLFCVPKNRKCPITQIVIGYQNSSNSSLDSYERSYFGDQFSIMFTRENNFPVAEFSITEGMGVCLNNSLPNISPNRADYVLVKKPRTACSNSNIDPRYKKTESSLSEYNFFLINDKVTYLQQNLPYFKDEQFMSKVIQYNLYYRGYVSLKYNCRDNLVDFKTQSINIGKMYNILLGQLIICCIFGAYLVLCEFWVSWCQSSSQKNQVGLLIYYEQNCLTVATFIIKYIMLLTTMVIICMAFSQFNKQASFYKLILTQLCLDDQTQALFTAIQKNLQVSYQNVIFSFWLCYLLLEPNFVHLIIVLFRKCCSKSSKLKESKEEHYYDDNKHKGSHSPQSSDKSRHKIEMTNFPPPQQPIYDPQNQFNNQYQQPGQFNQFGQQPVQQPGLYNNQYVQPPFPQDQFNNNNNYQQPGQLNQYGQPMYPVQYNNQQIPPYGQNIPIGQNQQQTDLNAPGQLNQYGQPMYPVQYNNQQIPPYGQNIPNGQNQQQTDLNAMYPNTGIPVYQYQQPVTNPQYPILPTGQNQQQQVQYPQNAQQPAQNVTNLQQPIQVPNQIPPQQQFPIQQQPALNQQQPVNQNPQQPISNQQQPATFISQQPEYNQSQGQQYPQQQQQIPGQQYPPQQANLQKAVNQNGNPPNPLF